MIQPLSVFSLNDPAKAEEVMMDYFQFQQSNNSLYKEFCALLLKNKSQPDCINEIPFLPVEFFKSREVITGGFPMEKNEIVFSSSGTTGQITSKHIVKEVSLYEESFQRCFQLFYGNPADYCFLFLLPSYLERSGSSLVYMAEKLIRLSVHNGSGFYLHNLEELKLKLEERKNVSQKTFLFGVSYALLDLAEKNIQLDDRFLITETGGMKGKRKEMIKDEFYSILKSKFGVREIHSEYGMTELLSQAWSKGEGKYKCPPWMKILIRDPYEPSRILPPGKTGCINVIDLANLYSCSFIATQDLGRLNEDGTFEVLGRMDNSELRGCNLMVD